MRKAPESGGLRRVVIEGVSPEVDGGRYPAKSAGSRPVTVEADVFTDGHDRVRAALKWKPEGGRRWRTAPMTSLGNDRWRGEFTPEGPGRYRFTIDGWVDAFGTWRDDLRKRVEAGQDVAVDLRIGAALIREAAASAPASAGQKLEKAAGLAEGGDSRAALDEKLARLMARHGPRGHVTRYRREPAVVVDRELAGFSAWYEMFPRSCAAEPGRHGTFRDVERMLPEIAEMGFDVLYLPPIHPIGTTFRKGKNNNVQCRPGEPGSPWAIGSAEGGHMSIHPELGTPEEFRRLVEAAREQGLEIALDIAFQASPDHPYVTEHPEWFRHRPDGTIQYAENPPKKYQDIYPFDFSSDQWPSLWEELRAVFLHWIGEGVTIFRVDNPHTKPFRFWEWCIGTIKEQHPGVIFLAEAFTRPRVMYGLAKAGFTQSYTYFPWRNHKQEIQDYFTELTRTPVRDYFRGNHWPNTPDILTEFLQSGGRPAFVIRLALSATLASNYGIYGPAFELCENEPLEKGKEEYLNAEKYEIRNWDRNRADSLKPLVARLNRIRRENPAMRCDRSLTFHEVDNDAILAYSKSTPGGENTILVVVSVDPYHVRSGWVNLALEELFLEEDAAFQAHDLISGARYEWKGSRNYVELNPQVMPAHVFQIRRRVRRESDFDYFT